MAYRVGPVDVLNAASRSEIPAEIVFKPPVAVRTGPVDALNAEVGVQDPSDDGTLIGKFILLLSSWLWEVSEARQVLVAPGGLHSCMGTFIFR